VAAHEQVAYVVLFATLEPARPQRPFAKFPGTGLANSLQINDINRIVDLHQFGVNARHQSLRQPDRQGWLRDVMAKGVVRQMPRMDLDWVASTLHRE